MHSKAMPCPCNRRNVFRDMAPYEAACSMSRMVIADVQLIGVGRRIRSTVRSPQKHTTIATRCQMKVTSQLKVVQPKRSQQQAFRSALRHNAVTLHMPIGLRRNIPAVQRTPVKQTDPALRNLFRCQRRTDELNRRLDLPGFGIFSHCRGDCRAISGF